MQLLKSHLFLSVENVQAAAEEGIEVHPVYNSRNDIYHHLLFLNCSLL